MTYGDWLRSRREAVGMTQRELGQRTGMDPSYISKIERSYYESFPSPERLQAICRALGTTPEEMLTSLGYLAGDSESDIMRTFASMMQEAEALPVPSRLRDSLKASIAYVRDQVVEYKVEE